MFTLSSTAILFSLLASLVPIEAAPLPMPAVKQSEQLASRFYNHPDSIYAHHTPCWDNGLQGILRDDVCILAALDIEDNRHVPVHQAHYVQGQPCSYNGQTGYWRDATCVLANLDVNLNKRDFIPFQGQECWLNGRRGYFTPDGLCDLIDLNIIADVNDGPAFLNSGRPATVPLTNKVQCWANGRPGFWQNDLCVLADLEIAKRYSHGAGIVGDVLDTLTGYEDCYNCGPGPTRHAVLPTDLIIDAEALVDVNDKSHDPSIAFPHKRNGLLHNAPDGNELDGAVRTVTQLLDHSVTKRGLLGINDIPIVSGGNTPAPKYTYYPNGYVQPEPVYSRVLADLEAEVNVDEGDEPYYGPGAHHPLGLGLKRDILGHGNGNNDLNVLSNLGQILQPQPQPQPHHVYPYPYPEYIRQPNGQIVPLQSTGTGTADILADVDAAIDLNNDREYIPTSPHVHHGLLGRNLGGLSGVHGLGLNKDGNFPQGLDVVPQVGDLLGAGKGKDTFGGLGKGTNGLSHIL
ncbi:uncharacterized protein I303_102537 [Kwoniella dejecticola CBS 10117]|uniref:Uncharacterized protein n=1 Tax=Kwoniella dejecticola CBS 10117 TaxID=1296121 RepID=A0A1A6A911_9TREE|nr:uncharacterized protein I303_02551 [Kwoniella dejecticola CBS 10117]OBR86543.1 hypothetical protein I303_02551 [Kwoniella dejecticola CBS 10117]